MSMTHGRYLRRLRRRMDYLAEKIAQRPGEHGAQWDRAELEALDWALRELAQRGEKSVDVAASEVYTPHRD